MIPHPLRHVLDVCEAKLLRSGRIVGSERMKLARGDLVALDGIGFGEEGAHIAHEISGYGWW